jgi:hypothetical protein
MGSLADGVALAALVLLSAMFVAAFFDEVDPEWSGRSLTQRALAMPVLTGLMVVVWLLAILGGARWPGQLAVWVAGWSFQAVLIVAAVLGLVVGLVGLALLLRQGLGARGATLRQHVTANQVPYAVLLVGVGMAQASIGSH